MSGDGAIASATDKKLVEASVQASEGEFDESVTATVCQLSSVSKYKLKVQVGETEVEAIVDTAAEVTIISEEVYKKLKVKPKTVKNAKLLTAGKELFMNGLVVGPVRLQIGSKVYRESIYVAPITQDMLLGFDLLHSKAVLYMRRGIINFDGEDLHLNVDKASGEPLVARVTVCKRSVVPPNSVMQVKCRVNRAMSESMIEPDEGLRVLVPKTVHGQGSNATQCVVNASDKFRLLKKGSEVANAYPVEEVLNPEVEVEVHSVEQVEVDENVKVPSHHEEVYAKSTTHLDDEKKSELRKLLVDYQDVFATSEFDLRNFTEIQHSIDPGTAKPIKQRMRRTPACLVAKEEAHLKMLEAGVIQESTSEWDSAPVFIRKRDGTVRWCIDYRALNNVCVKDVFPLPLVDDCLDTLAESCWFSKLDANSAYWQVKIKEEDRHKTAFVTKYGLYAHVKMGFGLCNAPATFSRVVNLVVRGLNWKTVLAFLEIFWF
ncbi:uncharacterized protein LOC128557239 [Mercenaria mercenaria]|uniref:uncharacterized protein LOC128557239 n=1 Tax=Mercenaria mercenaria TaxID=6596 RepID=UPI00234E3C1E|nr:uncharacterized protein LOC128557239 [Mercenaria mercenaria]